jgi:hypothetical protein
LSRTVSAWATDIRLARANREIRRIGDSPEWISDRSAECSDFQ